MLSGSDMWRSQILHETTCSGARLIVLSKASSTQDVARELASDGEQAWTAVMAREQTHGRGRLGHTWISPPGKNLAISVILRPSVPAARAPLLSMVAAVAVAEVLEVRGISNVKLKWPNDVLVDNKKIAGILLEASIVRDRVCNVILGLGVNINSEEIDFPHDFAIPPTSYRMSTGRAWELEDAARTFLRELKSFYEVMEKQGFELIIPQWLARWAHKNQLVTYEGKIGIAIGVSEEGFLILQMLDGSSLTVVSGDVCLVGDAVFSPCGERHVGKVERTY